MGEPDRDEDGHDSLACGGDDCDDSDAETFAGNGEVCDAAGHDEDCRPDTVGDRDVDRDGYVDSGCCNGATCGPDCDDADANVNPGAAEICDARDNDCDGLVDGAGAFCPVGVCDDRRCRSSDWERVYEGPALFDAVTAVATDRSGRSFVLVNVPEGADLDDDLVSEPAGTHVISLESDGRTHWVAPVTTPGRSLAVVPGAAIGFVSGRGIHRLAADTGTAMPPVPLSVSGDPSFAVIASSDTHAVVAVAIDGGLSVLAFDDAWSETARLDIPGTASAALHDLAVSDAGVALVGEAGARTSLGALSLEAGRFVVVLDLDLTPRWTWTLPTGLVVNPSAVAIADVGTVAVGGENTAAFDPPWGAPAWPAPMGEGDAFAVVFDGNGTHLFTHQHRGPGADVFGTLEFDGRGALLIGGLFTGSMPVSPRGTLVSPGASLSGFYMLRDATSTFTSTAGVFRSSGFTYVVGTAVDLYGGLLAVGRFNGSTELVLGSSYDHPGAGYVVRVADIGP